MTLPRPASREDREWAARAHDLEFNALPKIQATAEKWAGTIGALTGVFSIAAFIKGPEDIGTYPVPAKILLGLFVAIALVAAFIAMYQAALAAQGTIERVYNDPASIREAYRLGVERAGDRLQFSRRCTIVAVAALAIATGITWYTPVERADAGDSTLLVVQRSGTVVCGALDTDGTGALVIKASHPDAPPVPLVDIISLHSVDTCP